MEIIKKYEDKYTVMYHIKTFPHRLDGPAIYYKKSKSKNWYKYGKRHRLDGPAVITGENRLYWYINGHHVTDEIHQWAKEMNIDLDNLSDEDKFMIRLYWENYDE